MQNAEMKVTLPDDESKRAIDANLPCSLSLGEVDYFNFYLEQRVAYHVLRDEHANQRESAAPSK